jgi:hypothetical protein
MQDVRLSSIIYRGFVLNLTDKEPYMVHVYGYGVATMSRMLENVCLFAEYRSLL